MAIVLQDENKQVHNIFEMEDFRDIVGYDTYEAIEHFIEERIEIYKKENEFLKSVGQSDEIRIDSMTNCLVSIKNLLDDTLVHDLNNGIRLKRNDVNKIVKEILNLIEEEI
jgi:hypothetical protein